MSTKCDDICFFSIDHCEGIHQLEIKGFLESVYGMKVRSVRTMNVEGKTKMRHGRPYKRTNWKKAFVSFYPFDSSPEDVKQPDTPDNTNNA